MNVYVAIIASFLKMKWTLVAGGVCFIFFFEYVMLRESKLLNDFDQK